MSKIDLGKCCERVHSGYQTYDCSKPGKVVEDGKVYCGIHNPERARIRNKKYDLEREIKDAKYEIEKRIRLAKDELILVNKKYFHNNFNNTNQLNSSIYKLLCAERDLEIWGDKNNG